MKAEPNMLNGKKALVTGASGGIGRAIAQSLKASGATLAVSGSNVEKLNAFATELGGALPVVCDLTKLETIDAFAKEAEEKLGGLDVLVCNAGITKDTLTIRMNDEQWQQVIDINLTSTFRLVRAVLKGMVKRRSGRVILITSVVGHSGNAGQANYCASKAGMTGMAKAMALECASRGITVNCVAPGFIDTPMTEVLTDEQKARITQNIPQGRMGTPEDIAAAVAFLAGEGAAYITGQTIHVNGGLYLP